MCFVNLTKAFDPTTRYITNSKRQASTIKPTDANKTSNRTYKDKHKNENKNWERTNRKNRNT